MGYLSLHIVVPVPVRVWGVVVLWLIEGKASEPAPIASIVVPRPLGMRRVLIVVFLVFLVVVLTELFLVWRGPVLDVGCGILGGARGSSTASREEIVQHIVVDPAGPTLLLHHLLRRLGRRLGRCRGTVTRFLAFTLR